MGHPLTTHHSRTLCCTRCAPKTHKWDRLPDHGWPSMQSLLTEPHASLNLSQFLFHGSAFVMPDRARLELSRRADICVMIFITLCSFALVEELFPQKTTSKKQRYAINGYANLWWLPNKMPRFITVFPHAPFTKVSHAGLLQDGSLRLSVARRLSVTWVFLPFIT